jgi:hypothetical protein
MSNVKGPSFLNSKAAQFSIFVAVSVGMIWYVKKGLAGIAESIDPTSPENIFYQGVNSVGEILTEDETFDLGHWIYDASHQGN